MKTGNVPRRFVTRLNSLILVGVFIILAAVVAVPFYSVRSSSSPALDSRRDLNEQSVIKPDQILSASISPGISFPLLMPPAGTPSIATFNSTCATATTVFDLGQTACAKATSTGGIAANRRISWIDPSGFIRQVTPITSDPQNDLFPIPGTPTSTLSNGQVVNNIGTWRVNIISSRGSLVASASFLVKDAAHATADLSVTKGPAPTSEEVPAGSSGTFNIAVFNSGPEAAQTVVLTDVVPDNTTFVGMTQSSGLPTNTFFCTTPGMGSTGTVTCTIASLARGASATFSFAYMVNAGTVGGTLITNTATISSATNDSNTSDNSATASASVTSATGGACTLNCPNNITTVANALLSGVSGAYVTFPAAETFGTCGTVTSTPLSGSFFPVGTTAVNTTSSPDGAACSFVVTVLATAPTITCPANQAIITGACAFEATGVDPGTPTATGDTVVVTGVRSDDRPLTDPYPLGVTTITWTATDASGHTASCTQTITVTSSEPFAITCPANITVTAPSGACAATISDVGTPISNCNSTVEGVRSDRLPLTDPYSAGTTTITWTATDPTGHVVSCTQTITVNAIDITPPTITAPPDVTFCTTASSAFISDEILGTATATDNCSASVSIVRTGVPRIPCPTLTDPGRTCESNIFPAGVTILTYTATDAAGNTATATQTVTVKPDDGTPPTITAPANVTLFTGPDATSCSVTLSPNELNGRLGTAITTDTCSGVEVVRSGVPTGNVFPVGDTIIRYTATDTSGQTAFADQTVTVVDNTPPVIVSCAADVTVNTDPGACSTLKTNVNLGSPIATDNCGTVTATNDAPSEFSLGDTTVHWTVTDSHGNTAMCNQKVTVQDHEKPIITCPADVLNVPTEPGICAAHVNPGTATATDNCTVSPTITATRSDNQPLTATYPRGTTTITWTATDASGNHSSCDQTITVVDKEPPVIVLNGQTPSMWPPNHKYHTFGVTDFVTSVTDNCDTISIGSVAIAKVTSDEIENGNGDGNTLNDIVIAADCKSVQLRSERQGGGNGRVYTIYFSVSDTSGNVGTATAKVVVQHNPGETAVDSGVHYTVCCHGGTCP
jgi:uncharacterized repeat protein (TIGR01451 family)